MACVAAPQVGAQDSGSGVGLQFGNSLDPTGWRSSYGCDERGTSWLTGQGRRTPTGALYACAPDLPGYRAVGDWLYSVTLPLGFISLSGAERNTQLQRYSAWEDDFILGPFELSWLRPEDGTYVSLNGSRLNTDNQFYRFETGRGGAWHLQAYTRRQPNVVSDNAKSIWDGIGTDSLTLRPGLTPAGSTPAEVATVSAAAREQRLQVVRDKQGLGFNYYFNRSWTGFLNASYETRRGARPFGGPFFFNYPFANNGGIMEIPRPVDDSTTNVYGGARFVGQTWRMEFAYTGSFYRGSFRGYDYQNPFILSPVIPGALAPPLTTGQFAAEPDNDYHNLRVNVTRVLPLNGQLSLTGSVGRMRQNDDLLPPTNCQGQFGIDLSPTGAPVNPFLFNCSDWNTTASLSRTTADLSIDTSMLQARAVLQPTRAITLRADVRYRREDYRGDYIAYNPLTGQYGYVSENGSQGSVVPGEAGFWDPVTAASSLTRIRNLPLDKTTLDTSLGADWRLSRYDTLGATYSFNRSERDHREIANVRDNSLNLSWVNRHLSWMTLRASYTYLNRDGDPYNYDPYEFTMSSSLPGYIPPAGGDPAHTPDALRKYDIGGRNQHKLDLMATFIPHPDMTLSASVRGERNSYDAQLGRQEYDTVGTLLQWDWQPSPRTVASAYYGQDRSKLRLANVNDVALTADPTLGGITYPFSAQWWERDRQRNDYLGATLDQRIGRVRLDIALNYSHSRGLTDYRFASGDALTAPMLAATAGDGFPAMTYNVTSLRIGLQWPVKDNLIVRIFNLYERGRLFDWHYQGFDQQRVYDHRVYTDGGPRDYSGNLLGILFEMRLGEQPR